MFYTFRQNNSGGRFLGPVLVCVECDSVSDANDEAVNRHDIQFGMEGSCRCCGPRWSEARDGELSDSPEWYGKALADTGTSWVVYYKNGTKESGGKCHM